MADILVAFVPHLTVDDNDNDLVRLVVLARAWLAGDDQKSTVDQRQLQKKAYRLLEQIVVSHPAHCTRAITADLASSIIAERNVSTACHASRAALFAHFIERCATLTGLGACSLCLC